MRSIAGTLTMRIFVVVVISLMAAGVYLCCLIGGLSLRLRHPENVYPR